MLEKTKEFFVKSSTEGLYLPVAHETGKPSATLFFMYLSNLLAVMSLIHLHSKADPIVASSMTTVYSIVQTILYMIRRLHSAKIDLDNKSFELEGEKDE